MAKYVELNEKMRYNNKKQETKDNLGLSVSGR